SPPGPAKPSDSATPPASSPTPPPPAAPWTSTTPPPTNHPTAAGHPARPDSTTSDHSPAASTDSKPSAAGQSSNPNPASTCGDHPTAGSTSPPTPAPTTSATTHSPTQPGRPRAGRAILTARVGATGADGMTGAAAAVKPEGGSPRRHLIKDRRRYGTLGRRLPSRQSGSSRRWPLYGRVGFRLGAVPPGTHQWPARGRRTHDRSRRRTSIPRCDHQASSRQAC
ncbi:MAG: hypothetical protein JWN06_1633, partial [Propionibacteriaceae bacterium]|nr:hypothetical protein [Propionibacteriaceae bacterium]